MAISSIAPASGFTSQSAEATEEKGLAETAPCGRREWLWQSGYSKRSMVENAIYRYKAIIGRGMGSRTLAGQLVELQLACRILNTKTRLGMPDSYRVA